ncbi:MAG: MMPL family transporter [Gammaproteobacteria bacterium]
MQNPIIKNGRVVAYAEWIVRWRWAVLAGSLLLAVFMASGGRFIEFSSNYRYFFSEDNPQLLAFEELQNVYTKTDNILIVIAPDSENVFDKDVLAAVEYITEEAWRLPFAIRVDSLANFQHTRAEEDDLIVENLIENPEDMTPEEIDYARRVALDEPVIRNRLLAPDTRTTGVNVTFQFLEQNLNEIPQAADAARALARDVELLYPGVNTYLTGMVMMNRSFQESSFNDMRTLVPLMFAAIFVLMLLLVRSVAGIFGTILVVGMSAAGAMGLAGWAGIRLTPPSTGAATMIMTLAVADSVHLMVSMITAINRGLDKRAALVESLRVNMQPIFLTSITTAIGFLSMNFSDAPPFRDLGNITAAGVMLAFVFSVSFLPAVLAILPVHGTKVAGRYSGGMDALANFVIRRQKPLLVGVALLSIALISQIPRNELNDEFVRYFDQEIAFRADTDFATQNLTGIYLLQYSIPAGDSNGISDPGFLRGLDRFVEWLRAQPEVMHVSSITDTFKRLNKNMHGDDPDWYRLPEQRDLAAQYLLLYELSLPYGLDLNNQVNIDKSATQLVVTLSEISSVELRAIAQRGEAWLEENAPAMASVGNGPSIMFAYISERNIKSMLLGTSIGLVLISLVLIFALRSLKLGLISLIPNMLPAALGFGLWGLIVGQVNMAVSVVAAMTLGIVVDDTVHFISKYLRACRERGYNAEEAVRFAFSSVGMALIITTVVLVAGFMVLAQSSFLLNSSVAKLTSITVVLALIVDFFLLPPLLIATYRGKPVEKQIEAKEDEVYATT